MLEFFLLYLVISIERISGFLSLFLFFGWLLLVFALFWFLMVAMARDIDEQVSEAMQVHKKYIKSLILSGVILLALGSCSKLVPNQKEMILIAGGTATYHTLTSDPAKELGGKAFDALIKKLDKMTEDMDTIKETPEQSKNPNYM